MQATVAKLTGLRGLLCAAIAIACMLSGRVSPAEPLRLVSTFWFGPVEDIGDNKAARFDVEVLKQLFAAMGQDAFFEGFPSNRAWRLILNRERDGMINATRTSEREAICSFPDEPLSQERFVFFVRTADLGKLTFSSFDDLIGHDVAVREQVPGLFEQPTLSAELWKFLREHHNMVETLSGVESLQMLAAGRVDYAVVNLRFGMEEIARAGLSGKIEPLLSSSALEDNIYVCFTKERVSPSFVDAFSRALKQFKQTEAFQATYRKYFP
jgi:polar amino acid transport system substrate-binding protein